MAEDGAERRYSDAYTGSSRKPGYQNKGGESVDLSHKPKQSNHSQAAPIILLAQSAVEISTKQKPKTSNPSVNTGAENLSIEKKMILSSNYFEYTGAYCRGA